MLNYTPGVHRHFALAMLIVLASTMLFAQNGDKPGEAQKLVVTPERIPPAPVLTAEEQIKTLSLPPDFRVEIVASEPLVQTPVAMQFDHLGRLWVVEMTGYMRSPVGQGEGDPSGNVVILEDTDGDGRMDKRTVFLDHLVMPRSLMLFEDGVVVAEPPNLWFCRDTNGDGKSDEKTRIIDDYATQNDPKLGAKSNPEHASNGLLWALDNWIYSANHTRRYRKIEGRWTSQETISRGQWGLTQDDFGRLYHNSNSDQLRADLIPSHYLSRNPNLKEPYGANVQLVEDQRVWTARVNPGVNRGYQPNQLTPEGKLATFTGACGPVVYRGNQFPEDFRGDVFLCEPTGNILRRNRIQNREGDLRATNAYDHGEFLTSTDERFRPVSLYNGPDGTFYCIDIARGLIQHRIYLTSYLRQQIESRNLQTPLNLGRIYRIVYKKNPIARQESLSAHPTLSELLSRLSHPNGWWRDTAQRMLIDRRDPEATGPLRKLAFPSNNPSYLGRIHALWTLEGLGQLDLSTLEKALDDPIPKVRAHALRLSESFLVGEDREEAIQAIFKRAGFVPLEEQLQLILTLGQIKTPAGDAITKVLLMNAPPSPLRFDAALSGLGGRELEFLESMVGDPICAGTKSSHAPLITALARCIVQERRTERIERLLEITATLPPADWQQTALLNGMLTFVPASPTNSPILKSVKPIRFRQRPRSLDQLAGIANPSIQERLERLDRLFIWPDKPGLQPDVVTPPLTGDEQKSFDRGRELYAIICAACHLPHGNGQEGLAPPLVESEWTLGSEQRLARIVLHGVRDGITVKGRRYELNMPALATALEDQPIADILTYIRREWGHEGKPVAVETIAAARKSTTDREDSWTEAELLQVH